MNLFVDHCLQVAEAKFISEHLSAYLDEQSWLTVKSPAPTATIATVSFLLCVLCHIEACITKSQNESEYIARTLSLLV